MDALPRAAARPGPDLARDAGLRYVDAAAQRRLVARWLALMPDRYRLSDDGGAAQVLWPYVDVFPCPSADAADRERGEPEFTHGPAVADVCRRRGLSAPQLPCVVPGVDDRSSGADLDALARAYDLYVFFWAWAASDWLFPRQCAAADLEVLDAERLADVFGGLRARMGAGDSVADATAQALVAVADVPVVPIVSRMRILHRQRRDLLHRLACFCAYRSRLFFSIARSDGASGAPGRPAGAAITAKASAVFRSIFLYASAVAPRPEDGLLQHDGEDEDDEEDV